VEAIVKAVLTAQDKAESEAKVVAVVQDETANTAPVNSTAPAKPVNTGK
jgi:hypothetical protein